ncbi:hypothetical protein IQ230_13865 [Gloeocapsopsis crepidinum LEGE 06123]|uniref:Tyr recombinase domain-containing protein n=1 Tax=Gloeocapsopsis crepidinum LEGE 06123 TaxID=588587 RepID=A0ABR9UTP7_9CHRO|nr:hypothetical protein [Gloeocapsopsis crepidinum]MBE9191413.1 hypothetical protein [Gloeocapsopsis crepidinum LEGE 06123]
MLEKDLRYPAQRIKQKQEADLVHQVIAEEIDQANQFLKAQGIKVRLMRNANSIQLTATLPARPGDKPTSKRGTKQYRISHLKCFASLEGIKKALKEAIHLDELMRSHRFSWEDYTPQNEAIALPQTWRECVELFEQNYWTTRSKNRKSLCTWDKSYADLFKKLDLDAKINDQSILTAIKKTQAHTVTRNNLIRVLKAVCKSIKYEFDFTPYACPPSKIKRKERKIPSDEEIIQAWETMPDESTKWVFGMLATYGLRPEEIFINPHFEEYAHSSNTLHIFRVDSDCKTGERKVLPLKPEWVELFDLKNISPLQTRAKNIETIVSWVNKKFRKSPHWKRGAYDLRHGYAIRGHKYGIPIADMARYMGHDVETHVKEYQRWIGIDTMIEVYLEATHANHKSRKALITENALLTVENKRLREQITKLEQDIKFTEIQP